MAACGHSEAKKPEGPRIHRTVLRAPTCAREPAVRALDAATVGGDGARAGLAAGAGEESGDDVGGVPVE